VQGSVVRVDARLPGTGNANPHGTRPVHLIITMIQWTRASRLSIQNSLSRGEGLVLLDEFRLHRNVQRFRGGLIFKAHRLFVSLNSRLESKKECRVSG